MDGSWIDGADRSQSEVLGTALILGLSMAVVGSSLVVGGVALDGVLTDLESSNVENGMSHFSSQASLVALGEADSQRFSLGSMREGTLTVRPDAGSITIYNATDGDREQLNTKTSLGAVVYEGPDREIAYQGGGIWTKYDNTSRVTSPPEYYYRDETLTLPIINVTGEGSVGGQPQGRITPVEVATDAVPSVTTPLDTGVIEVEIQSEYYKGWYAYLSQRTDGETIIDHENETVISRLTVPDEVVIDTGLSVQTTYSARGSADINGPIAQNVPHRSAKPLISDRVQDAKAAGTGNGCLGGGYCELTAGTYLYEGDLTLTDDLDLDTSGGNITVIVDGDFDIENKEVTVTDNSTPENGVEYYVSGSLQAKGNSFVGTDDPTVSDDRDVAEPERNVFYVGEGFLDDSRGGGTIDLDAIIYAPDADVDSNGNARITGSIVANSLDIGGNFEINHDSAKSPYTTLEITGAADLLKYLHVSHNEVRVELN